MPVMFLELLVYLAFAKPACSTVKQMPAGNGLLSLSKLKIVFQKNTKYVLNFDNFKIALWNYLRMFHLENSRSRFVFVIKFKIYCKLKAVKDLEIRTSINNTERVDLSNFYMLTFTSNLFVSVNSRLYSVKMAEPSLI